MKLATSIGDQIAGVVRARISSGEYGPGTRLVERTLADEFGTSQGPVRDAIRTLESQGLVRSKPNAGSWVKGTCHLELAAAAKVKSALLQLGGELAAVQLAGNTASLKAIHDQISLAAREGRMGEVVRLFGELHWAIISASGNEALATAWNSLGTAPACILDRFEMDFDLDAILRTEVEIIGAIQFGNSALAGQLLHQQMSQFAHSLANAQPKTTKEN